MRVLVTGSRDWTGIYGDSKIYMVLNMLLAFCEVLGQKLTIVHGDGPGADQTIDAWAVRRDDAGVTVERTIGTPIDFAVVFVRDGVEAPHLAQFLPEASIPTYTVHWTEEERE